MATQTSGPRGDAAVAEPSATDTTLPASSAASAAAPPSTAALDAPVQIEPGLQAQITRRSALSVKAHAPGETSGAAVALTVQVRNTGSARLDLGQVIVDAKDASGGSLPASTTAPAKPLSGSLAPGQQASGVYVFVQPESKRDGATVVISRTANASVVMKGNL